MVRLFSFLIPKGEVEIAVDGAALADPATASPPAPSEREVPGQARDGDLAELPLIRLAWLRSGDKGNKANIGVIARKPEYLPWIWAALSEQTVAGVFEHFLDGGVERYYLPGSHSINFLLHEVLGGGGIASLRNDPQGKGYAQILLAHPIPVPGSLAEAL